MPTLECYTDVRYLHRNKNDPSLQVAGLQEHAMFYGDMLTYFFSFPVLVQTPARRPSSSSSFFCLSSVLRLSLSAAHKQVRG